MVISVLLDNGSVDEKWRHTDVTDGGGLCAIYEPGRLKANMEHENHKAGSDNMKSEWDSGQDNIQLLVPRDFHKIHLSKWSYS